MSGAWRDRDKEDRKEHVVTVTLLRTKHHKSVDTEMLEFKSCYHSGHKPGPVRCKSSRYGIALPISTELFLASTQARQI